MAVVAARCSTELHWGFMAGGKADAMSSNALTDGL
jgi:hypothetical protein